MLLHGYADVVVNVFRWRDMDDECPIRRPGIDSANLKSREQASAEKRVALNTRLVARKERAVTPATRPAP